MQQQYLRGLHALSWTRCWTSCCTQTPKRNVWNRQSVIPVVGMARRRDMSGRLKTQHLDDQLVSPRRPSSNGSPIIPLDEVEVVNNRTVTGQEAPPARKQQRQEQNTNTKHDSRRGTLVKIRVAPRRYRLRKSFDQPRNVRVSPSDPTFEGRLTSEINSCYGPRQLTKIIRDFGLNLTAGHCAAAISQLAGQVTGKHLSQEQLQDTYQAPAANVADILTTKIAQASMMDCARAVYGLTRLQLHVPALLTAVEQHTTGQLSSAPPQALAGTAAGFAHWGYKPSGKWIQELCMESFAQMSAFSAQDLANLLFALACWQVSTSQPFLQRCLTAFRGHFGAAGCHAPTLIRFIFAVNQLPACQPLPEGMLKTLPPSAAVYQHHDSWRKQQELQEMSKVMGLMQQGTASTAPTRKSTGQRQSNPDYMDLKHEDNNYSSNNKGTSSSGSSSRQAATTYRLPSFNWLVAFLAECRRQIDRMKPAELAILLWSMAGLNHTPDLIFMECWYRASAAHMHAFTPQALATAVAALGMLRPGRDVPGGVSGRWLQLVLQRSRQQFDKCSDSELVMLLWGLAELRVWPGQDWMNEWLAAVKQQLPSLAPSDLSDAVWALARLRYTPTEPWMDSISAAVTSALPGFTAQQLAVVIWGFSSLGQKPDRRWLVSFKGLAGSQYEDEAAQQLAKFVAEFLAQQNRRQFLKPINKAATAAAAPTGKRALS